MPLVHRRALLRCVVIIPVFAAASFAMAACDAARAPTAVVPVKLPSGRDTMPTVTPTDSLASTADTSAKRAVDPARIAELPRDSVDTTYPVAERTIRVGPDADLQAALDAAQPGDELLLAPGATYVGEFVLPNKGSSTNWIVVRTDVSDATLGAAGTRMTPSRAANIRVARLLTSTNGSVLSTAAGAHHWRLTGLELGGTSSAQEISGIVRLGAWDESEPTVASMAHHLVLDRVYIHGTPTQAVRRCLLLSSGTAAVVDSWLSDCHSNNGDSQAILAIGGSGPYKIDDNTLSGGHEVVMFGGGDPYITNLVASDITITRNDITRPVADRGVWQVKTLFELKSASRVLIQGNVLHNNWADAQDGFGLLVKSVNQDGGCSGCGTHDVTVIGNVLKNTGAGINIAGDVQGPSLITSRVTLVDNLVDSLNVGPYSGPGIPLQLLAQATDVSISHLTAMPMPSGGLSAISFDGTPMVRLAITASVFPRNEYGIHGSDAADGTNSLERFAPGGVFTANAVVGGNCAYYPSTTVCPRSWPATLPLAADGKPIGADLSRIATLTRGVVLEP